MRMLNGFAFVTNPAAGAERTKAGHRTRPATVIQDTPRLDRRVTLPPRAFPRHQKLFKPPVNAGVLPEESLLP